MQALHAERQKRADLEQRLAAEVAQRDELVTDEIRLRQRTSNLQVSTQNKNFKFSIRVFKQ